jgi:hypothetical protein
MEEVLQKCKNCDAPVRNNYCDTCGQSTKTRRIDAHYLLHEVQHSVMHVDRGIFYTIKELLIRPGSAIREYLEGKRVRHFKPFALVVILGAIYSFAVHFFNVYPENELLLYQDSEESIEYSRKVTEWIYRHYSMVMLVSIPFFALTSYWVFRKKDYNYSEYLVIYSYIAGIQTLLSLFAFVFYYIFSSWEIVLVSLLFAYLYYIWVFVQLFAKDLWFITAIKAILSYIIAYAMFMLLIALIVIIIMLINHEPNL